jgi:predicted unusual protein kinase regulating ubiquinone biosynthesis (AarF/ABC1/UbiB family)
MAKKDPKDLEKIASSTLSRSLSLLGLTVSTGAKFASLKVGDLFCTPEEKNKRFEQYLAEQAQEIANELGKLKGSMMKAGQMLSVYGEHFLPPEINQVLKTLQQNSQPVAWEQMSKILQRELGKETLGEFDLDPKPRASASLGQVYQAWHRKTKKQVALKVQYPGVDKAIDSDLKSLKSILSLAHLVPMGPNFDELFKEIRMMLHWEADYKRELETLLDYKTKLQGHPRLVVPEAYPQWSTGRVLAMAWEEGLPVDSPEVLGLSQVRRNQIGCTLLDLLFKEIFEWRMVQTDPHLGNYRIRLSEAGDQILLFDFGAVRHFPKRYIDPFARLVGGALRGDAQAIIKEGIELGFLKPDDRPEVSELFLEICFMAIEGFGEEYESPSLDGSEAGEEPYPWKEKNLMGRVGSRAKDALFTFRLRPPPREALFMDRKLVGSYVFATVLGMKFGPRRLMLEYIK